MRVRITVIESEILGPRQLEAPASQTFLKSGHGWAVRRDIVWPGVAFEAKCLSLIHI
jgi:hypothetical protein